MFKIKDFIMKTLEQMKDHYPQFQVREYALNWYAKGVLVEDDLMAIEEWYLPKVEETPIIEEVPIVEETETVETVEEITQEIVE